ncbi:MAG TPA: hypothetical protein VIO37_10515 [Candidatus Dormibacteraeota bacterium]|jgi:hypothetical protein
MSKFEIGDEVQLLRPRHGIGKVEGHRPRALTTVPKVLVRWADGSAGYEPEGDLVKLETVKPPDQERRRLEDEIFGRMDRLAQLEGSWYQLLVGDSEEDIEEVKYTVGRPCVGSTKPAGLSAFRMATASGPMPRPTMMPLGWSSGS